MEVSSKRKAGKKKKGVNIDSSSQVDESIAANGVHLQGGSNEAAQNRPRAALKSLPPEMISEIVKRESMMDHVNLLSAFVTDPLQETLTIREGVAVNLREQRKLYLQVDQGEYDIKYQYNYKLENILSNAFLPELEGLPISSEHMKHISLPELERSGVGDGLSESFPNLQELKIVLRDFSPAKLTKLADTVEALSKQLTTLQVLILGDNCHGLTHKKLNRFISRLNGCEFDRLHHFTLALTGVEKMFTHSSQREHLIQLTLLSTVEECYLRLPLALIQQQLGLLEANQRLIRLGLIAYCRLGVSQAVHMKQFAAMSSELAGKITHLEIPGYLQPIPYLRIPQCTSLTTVRLYHVGSVKSNVLHILAQSGSLRQLEINLDLYVRSSLVYARAFNRQHTHRTPLLSVTHLKVRVNGLRDHSQLEDFLKPAVWFPNLREFSVEFYSSEEYSSSLLNCQLCYLQYGPFQRTQAELNACQQKAVRPFRTLFNLERCNVLDCTRNSDQFVPHQ